MRYTYYKIIKLDSLVNYSCTIYYVTTTHFIAIIIFITIYKSKTNVNDKHTKASHWQMLRHV